jgi:hypothetical protein
MADETKTPRRPVLDDETYGMLQDFCEAHHESNGTAVANKAVRAFIKGDLATNDGVRAVYDALRAKRAEKGSE